MSGNRAHEIAQQSVTDALIALYELDLTSYDLGIARFTSSNTEKEMVTWNGEVYAPYPVEVTGFEWNGQSAPPTPTLKMSTVLPVLTALIIGGNDLIGSKFTRIRTFRRFLDDGEEPSLVDTFQMDEFRVNRKVAHNKIYAEFELSSVLDQQGVYLPKRQAIRDYCTFVYRRWDKVHLAFDYDPFIPCPYTGTLYFDVQGRDTTRENDRCSKTLSACRKRFGQYSSLPFLGFPGMSLV